MTAPMQTKQVVLRLTLAEAAEEGLSRLTGPVGPGQSRAGLVAAAEWCESLGLRWALVPRREGAVEVWGFLGDKELTQADAAEAGMTALTNPMTTMSTEDRQVLGDAAQGCIRTGREWALVRRSNGVEVWATPSAGIRKPRDMVRALDASAGAAKTRLQPGIQSRMLEWLLRQKKPKTVAQIVEGLGESEGVIMRAIARGDGRVKAAETLPSGRVPQSKKDKRCMWVTAYVVTAKGRQYLRDLAAEMERRGK